MGLSSGTDRHPAHRRRYLDRHRNGRAMITWTPGTVRVGIRAARVRISARFRFVSGTTSYQSEHRLTPVILSAAPAKFISLQKSQAHSREGQLFVALRSG